MSLVGVWFKENDPRFGLRRIVEVVEDDGRGKVVVRNIRTKKETRIRKTALDSDRQTGWTRIAQPGDAPAE